MSYEQFGVCPDCKQIVSWADSVCSDKACQRQLMKLCKCGEKYWIWWNQCRKCKEEFPPEGPRLVIPPPPPNEPPPWKPWRPFPKIPSKQYNEKGPCCVCYYPDLHWEMKRCPGKKWQDKDEPCNDLVERKCLYCKSFLVPWWHLCKYCKMPNKFK